MTSHDFFWEQENLSQLLQSNEFDLNSPSFYSNLQLLQSRQITNTYQNVSYQTKFGLNTSFKKVFLKPFPYFQPLFLGRVKRGMPTLSLGFPLILKLPNGFHSFFSSRKFNLDYPQPSTQWTVYQKDIFCSFFNASACSSKQDQHEFMFPQNQNELRFQHWSKINSGSLCFTIVPSFVDLELLTKNQFLKSTYGSKMVMKKTNHSSILKPPKNLQSKLKISSKAQSLIYDIVRVPISSSDSSALKNSNVDNGNFIFSTKCIRKGIKNPAGSQDQPQKLFQNKKPTLDYISCFFQSDLNLEKQADTITYTSFKAFEQVQIQFIFTQRKHVQNLNFILNSLSDRFLPITKQTHNISTSQSREIKSIDKLQPLGIKVAQKVPKPLYQCYRYRNKDQRVISTLDRSFVFQKQEFKKLYSFAPNVVQLNINGSLNKLFYFNKKSFLGSFRHKLFEYKIHFFTNSKVNVVSNNLTKIKSQKCSQSMYFTKIPNLKNCQIVHSPYVPQMGLHESKDSEQKKKGLHLESKYMKSLFYVLPQKKFSLTQNMQCRLNKETSLSYDKPIGLELQQDRQKFKINRLNCAYFKLMTHIVLPQETKIMQLHYINQQRHILNSLQDKTGHCFAHEQSWYLFKKFLPKNFNASQYLGSGQKISNQTDGALFLRGAFNYGTLFL